VTLGVHGIFENNLQILNLLQTPIVQWIAHIFVEAIQGGCVQIGNQEDMKFDSQIWNNHFFWDNIARCPLLNVMLACSNGNVFVDSIDTIGERRMPITYVMHWVDTSKPLELTTLYKFV
jgi:hypothetical protein